MNPAPIIIRADSSPQIGTGHVMRMIALAQAWQELGGSVVFAVAMELGSLEDRLDSLGIQVVKLKTAPGSVDDASQTLTYARSYTAKWIVFDGYHFDTPYQQALSGNDIRLLCVDDAGYAGRFEAEIILNQNLSANEELYSNRPSATQLLPGPKFALLRREFWGWRTWTRDIPDQARNILVTLGGSDPDNVTLENRPILGGFGAINVQCPRRYRSFQSPSGFTLSEGSAHLGERCEIIVNSNEMPALMAWADVTITAGGSTCWELAMMGMPMMLVVLADNQQGVSQSLAASGAAINLGWHESLEQHSVSRTLAALLHDPQRRKMMSNYGRSLVDGHGASLVANLLI